MESQELSTGTGMEAAHGSRPRPNQDGGCGHSESNPVESFVCDANTATKVHRVLSCTEFFSHHRIFSDCYYKNKHRNTKSENDWQQYKKL